MLYETCTMYACFCPHVTLLSLYIICIKNISLLRSEVIFICVRFQCSSGVAGISVRFYAWPCFYNVERCFLNNFFVVVGQFVSKCCVY